MVECIYSEEEKEEEEVLVSITICSSVICLNWWIKYHLNNLNGKFTTMVVSEETATVANAIEHWTILDEISIDRRSSSSSCVSDKLELKFLEKNSTKCSNDDDDLLAFWSGL